MFMEIILWLVVSVAIYIFSAWLRGEQEQRDQMPSTMISPHEKSAEKSAEKPVAFVAKEVKPILQDKHKTKKPTVTYASILEEYGHNRLSANVQLSKESLERNARIAVSLERNAKTSAPPEGYKFSRIAQPDAKTLIDWKNSKQAQAYQQAVAKENRLLEFLKNPESMQQAFIVSEIMKRPEW